MTGTKIVFNALRKDEIQLYPEYTAELHVLLNLRKEVIDSLGNNADAVYEYVNQQFQEQFNLQWLRPFGFENSYAVIMRQKHSDRLNIDTISGLAKHDTGRIIC